MNLIYNIFVKELYKFPLIIYNIQSSWTSSRDSKLFLTSKHNV